jgi:hypothetical protein
LLPTDQRAGGALEPSLACIAFRRRAMLWSMNVEYAECANGDGVRTNELTRYEQTIASAVAEIERIAARGEGWSMTATVLSFPRRPAPAKTRGDRLAEVRAILARATGPRIDDSRIITMIEDMEEIGRAHRTPG